MHKNLRYTPNKRSSSKGQLKYWLRSRRNKEKKTTISSVEKGSVGKASKQNVRTKFNVRKNKHLVIRNRLFPVRGLLLIACNARSITRYKKFHEYFIGETQQRRSRVFVAFATRYRRTDLRNESPDDLGDASRWTERSLHSASINSNYVYTRSGSFHATRIKLHRTNERTKSRRFYNERERLTILLQNIFYK